MTGTEKTAMGGERTYIATELCPHCESEIEMRWDTDTRGFQAFCPVCGERLMLCDECRHADDGPCDYDSDKDTCRRRRMEMVVMHPLEVDTPLGTIIAEGANDGEHPGIWLSLIREDGRAEIPIAIVESVADEGDLPEGESNLITRVWGDGKQREYTDRVVHKGIGGCPRTGDAEPQEGYIVLCYPTQALGMIVDLGSGPTTENGDRSSQYFTIAKGRNHIDRTVSVALIENINGLPEGGGYYTLHLVDDVNDEPCKLYHTDDLREESLVNLLKEILDDLERSVSHE